ncbi:MAG: exo-alpha-sialidase [Armatimonadetes bacterium]|nr:exo-alpha-sialidase [Armatimonadota bacterium]
MAEGEVTSPLAQEFVVINRTEDPEKENHRTDGPTLVRLPSGRLVVSYVLFHLHRRGQTHDPMKILDTRVKVSDDDGATWREVAVLPHELGLLFAHQGRLHLLGVEAGRGGLVITVSDDEGATWTPPRLLRQGRFWNTSTAMVIRNNTLSWCIGVASVQDRFNNEGSRTAALAADLTRNLTDPDAWRISDYLTYPGTPPLLRGGPHETPEEPYHDHWLEGNVVDAPDGLQVFWRARIRGGGGQMVPAIAPVCDLEDDGTTLRYRFRQFVALPGAWCKFHILRDDVTGRYWLTSNLGHRGVLALHSSSDARTWFPAGYLVVWPENPRSANYVTPLIDGDDLLIASRTSSPKAVSRHDNDMITFHRVRGFRSLALDIHPRYE